MILFSQWSLDERRKLPVRPKHTAVAHADIDRWLKSVDGLAKDLQNLTGAKKKAQEKMTQIGQKYKPEDEDEKEIKKPVEKQPVEKPKEEIPQKKDKPKPNSKKIEIERVKAAIRKKAVEDEPE